MDKKFCVVIPAYEPGEELIGYTMELIGAGISQVIVVDDGSNASYGAVFGQLKSIEECIVLHHVDNMGKGAALKTAIRWCLNGENHFAGIITADCDGQHRVKDAMRVAEALWESPEKLVLGCRVFDGKTPSKSALGNRVISAGMKLLHSIELEDTQTGLRGLPERYLADLLEVQGERYEYELNMLMYMRSIGIAFAIVPIAAIYFDSNKGSHFRPVRDSLRILAQLCAGVFRYGAKRYEERGFEEKTNKIPTGVIRVRKTKPLGRQLGRRKQEGYQS